MSAAWLLSDIAEAKGRQGSIHPAPQVLSTLRETALVQSVESSNRIEGITVDPGRLRPLVLGDDRPRDRRLRDAGQVESLGRGPGARWRRRGRPQ